MFISQVYSQTAVIFQVCYGLATSHLPESMSFILPSVLSLLSTKLKYSLPSSCHANPACRKYSKEESIGRIALLQNLADGELRHLNTWSVGGAVSLLK